MKNGKLRACSILLAGSMLFLTACGDKPAAQSAGPEESGAPLLLYRLWYLLVFLEEH